MNAPFHAFAAAPSVRLAEPDGADLAALAAFLADHPATTPFHRAEWLEAVAKGTGARACGLVAERQGAVVGWLPLHEVHSPLFGRALASSGFAVGGGVLVAPDTDPAPLIAAAEELAARRSCASLELRGGVLPDDRAGWTVRRDSHAGFVRPLAADDAAELLAIPRKQRAEVRKGLERALAITVGTGATDRAAHYAVYAESVRNLGTPVFPRALFDAVLDRFGTDADILTVWDGAAPVASVLSLYHRGAVMPYWGGGTRAARALRANDRMYFELMRHARARGCTAFDFGRSKVGSGAHAFKRNWGFAPEPLAYAGWTATGARARDVNPASEGNRALVRAWQRMPLWLANRVGPVLARGLG